MIVAQCIERDPTLCEVVERLATEGIPAQIVRLRSIFHVTQPVYVPTLTELFRSTIQSLLVSNSSVQLNTGETTADSRTPVSIAPLRSEFLATKQRRDLLGLARDEKTGAHVLNGFGDPCDVLQWFFEAKEVWPGIEVLRTMACSQCEKNIKTSSLVSLSLVLSLTTTTSLTTLVDTYTTPNVQEEQNYECSQCNTRVAVKELCSLKLPLGGDALMLKIERQESSLKVEFSMNMEVSDVTMTLIGIIYHINTNHFAVAVRCAPDGSAIFLNSHPSQPRGELTPMTLAQLREFKTDKISALLYSTAEFTETFSPIRSVFWTQNNCYFIAALQLAAAYKRTH